VSDDIIERAGLLEEVGRARHDHEVAFDLQSLLRLTVERNDWVIVAANDQKCRRVHCSSALPAKSGRPPRETTAKMLPSSAAATSAAPAPVLAPK